MFWLFLQNSIHLLGLLLGWLLQRGLGNQAARLDTPLHQTTTAITNTLTTRLLLQHILYTYTAVAAIDSSILAATTTDIPAGHTVSSNKPLLCSESPDGDDILDSPPDSKW